MSKPEYSKCCLSGVHLYSGDEGTNHYICNACNEPCDIVYTQVSDNQPTSLDKGALIDRLLWDVYYAGRKDAVAFRGESAAIDKGAAVLESLLIQERLDELRLVMKETETGDVSIWVYKWAKKRIAELLSLTEGGE